MNVVVNFFKVIIEFISEDGYLIFNFGLFILLMVIISKVQDINKYIDIILDYKYTKLAMNTDIEQSSKSIEYLNNHIENIFNDYIVTSSDLLTNMIISEEKEQRIMKEVTSLVTSNMSKSFVLKLSTIIPMEAISEYVSTKVYILITSYVLDNNSSK